MNIVLTPEPLMGDVRWWPLAAHWPSVYEHDRDRISRFAAAMRLGDATR